VSSFFIQPIGFPASEHDRLEALLIIGRGMLRDDWHWTTEGPADIYLVAVESLAQWEKHRAKLPPERLVACVLPGLEPDARWRIKRAPEHLPSFRELTQVLNSAAEGLPASAVIYTGAVPHEAVKKGLAPAAAPATVLAVPPESAAEQPVAPAMAAPEIASRAAMLPPEPIVPVPGDRHHEPSHPALTAAVDGDVYDPEEYLIGIVREALADGVPRRAACADGGGALLIEPERRLYFVPGDEVLLWPTLSAPRSQIEVQRLTYPELIRDTRAMQAHGLSLSDLVFLSALEGSRGRLWIGCRPDEPVRLRQWPDLKPLPQYVEFINLAAFMSGNTADIRMIAAHTGVPEKKVINFHNACGALDLLDRGGKVSIRQKPVNAGVKTLYRQIAKRLQSEV
jgi:hypothetical protein